MNINSVNKYPISTIFNPAGNAIYEIPMYQREYIWGIGEWEDMFDDLMENGNGYFIGSIICINVAPGPLGNMVLEVVDGQQRLTTISLLLAALYEELDSRRIQLNPNQAGQIYLLQCELVLNGNQVRVIPQIQGQNKDDYMGLLSERKLIPDQGIPKYAGNRRIFRGYNYFRRRIKEQLDGSANPIGTLFNILNKVNSAIMVMIEVTSHTDAYMLFEALNNRGTPLSALDLIKNMLLARVSAVAPANLDNCFSQWTWIMQALGDDDAVRERFFRQNYNAFRKDYNAPFVTDDRIYPLGSIATRSNLLQIYGNLMNQDPLKFLNEIRENAALYSKIILQDTQDLSPETEDAYLDLQRVQGAPAYMLLYLLRKKIELDISDALHVKIVRLLVNFFVRRNLTDLPPTRNLARMFMSFTEELEKEGYTGDTIYSKLRAKLVSASADDTAFEEKLRGPVYRENRDVTRFILCTIARNGMASKTQLDLWKRNNNGQYVWTIEHIFPEGDNIPDEWVDMIADGDRTRAREYLDEYAHCFGNLTITAYNSTLGNKSFVEKKERRDNKGNYIGYRNNLNLNADVADKDKWTVDMIKARTERLVGEILKQFTL